MNWDDPRARARLYQQLGRLEFDRQYTAHLRASIVETCNGYNIRRVQSRYGGYFFLVDGLGYGATTVEEARVIAKDAPPRGTKPKPYPS